MEDQRPTPPERTPGSSSSRQILSLNRPTQSTAGYVDFYGPSPLGWVIGGWISAAWDQNIDTPSIELSLNGMPIAGRASLLFYSRPDIGKSGHGLVIVLPEAGSTSDTLDWITLFSPNGSFTLAPAVGAERLTRDRILEKARTSFGSSPVTGNRGLIQQFLTQQPGGEEIPAGNPASSVPLVVEQTYLVPPNGAVLRGWLYDPTASARSIHIQGNGTLHTLRPGDWIRLPRPDVIRNVPSAHGGPDGNYGFLAYVPNSFVADGTTVIAIETADGNLAYKNVPPPSKQGLAAIESLLSGLHLRYRDLAKGFDRVLGPAITAINMQRVAVRPRVDRIDFGQPVDNPRCSIVVPLYGRIDFMEDQLAVAPQSWGNQDEVIYVLDDPRQLDDTRALARSCHERFKRPFTVLFLDRNMGYAPANNIGIAHARGKSVCLLNSDIIPQEPLWLDYMIETLDGNENIGAVGALLLFEDGSVQHEGCVFDSIPEFANWHFPIHVNKGFKPESYDGISDVDMVTGACVVMDRARFLKIGGLDEGYIIGDFEDADLCRRLQAQGLRCVVDRRAVLYHLERQSQDSEKSSWRLNLTLFNAWRHNRRWNPAVGDSAE